ncbi:MAG: NADH-quinone oxidoreductase subunit NuoE [Sulfuricellaceae bacterium]|nr:NADH-quinone oxidoreductase subunit NuoE [Sulfuricellaceae bacterium]
MLSPAALQQIDREVAKYPPQRKESAVMSALRIAQTERGWLAPETIEFVANYLEMPPIAAFEVASFYNMYDLSPVGRYKLTVCTNLSCTLMGAESVAGHLKQKLGIGFNETTPDGKFTLKEGECMGACGDGPVALVNNVRMCGKLTPAEADRILAELE